MRPSRLGVSGAVWGRRIDDVRSTASAVADGRGRAGRNKDGGGGVGHVVDRGADLDKVIEWLSDGVVVVSANAEEVLLKAFVKSVEDGEWGSQFEETMGDENYWELSKVSLYNWSSSRSGVGKIEVC